MIDDQWTLLRATIINERGHDGLIDFLECEKCIALELRAAVQTRERMSPDYDGMTPRGLQQRAADALGAKRG